MTATDEVLTALRTWGRQRAGELVSRLGISRPTLMRAVRALGPEIVSLGSARRTTYAARRAIRGNTAPLPLYLIDEAGEVHEVATLYPTHPTGCAVAFARDLGWPLDDAMVDGWFDGVPYMLDDLRPQGFLGRHFARAYALPKTRSGKLVRRAIQAVCEGRDPGDLTTLEDPSALAQTKDLFTPT